MSHSTLKITLKKSPIGCLPKHVQTLRSLGLRKREQTVVQPNHPSVLGKVNQIYYLLDVQENS